jgi:hypothetical protein
MINSNGDVVVPQQQPEMGPWCLGLSDIVSEEDRITGIDLRALPPDTTLVVETRNSTYRLGTLGESDTNVWIQGGAFFRDRTRARVEGATDGGSPIKIGWICVGLRLEISVGRRHLVTSPVQSISVEASSPSQSRLEPVWHTA